MAAAFAVLVVTALGVPLPATLFLLALGSFVEQGDLDVLPVMGVALGATLVGDQIGYGLGRVGGRTVVDAIVRHTGRAEAMHRAEAFTERWGAPGIFLSRWLLTALGPWINISSGVTRYPWPRFLLWDLAGEALWIALYVTLGRLFSDRVQDLAELVASIGYLLVALLVAGGSGWLLLREFRRAQRRMRGRGGED